LPQAELGESLAIPIEQGLGTEPFNEAPELTGRCRTLKQVHEVRFNASLGEKAQCLPCVGAFPDPEDLNFHAFGG
jgi:hypothetical protein